MLDPKGKHIFLYMQAQLEIFSKKFSKALGLMASGAST